MKILSLINNNNSNISLSNKLCTTTPSMVEQSELKGSILEHLSLVQSIYFCNTQECNEYKLVANEIVMQCEKLFNETQDKIIVLKRKDTGLKLSFIIQFNFNSLSCTVLVKSAFHKSILPEISNKNIINNHVFIGGTKKIKAGNLFFISKNNEYYQFIPETIVYCSGNSGGKKILLAENNPLSKPLMELVAQLEADDFIPFYYHVDSNDSKIKVSYLAKHKGISLLTNILNINKLPPLYKQNFIDSMIADYSQLKKSGKIVYDIKLNNILYDPYWNKKNNFQVTFIDFQKPVFSYTTSKQSYQGTYNNSIGEETLQKQEILGLVIVLYNINLKIGKMIGGLSNPSKILHFSNEANRSEGLQEEFKKYIDQNDPTNPMKEILIDSFLEISDVTDLWSRILNSFTWRQSI